jgi:hypothetical protein
LKKKCEDFEGNTKKLCEQVVRRHIKEMVSEVKNAIQSIKDNVKDLREAIKERKLLNKKTIDDMKLDDASGKNVEKLAELKQTMYYNIAHQCGKKIIDSTKLEDTVKQIPAIREIDAELAAVDRKIATIRQKVDISVNAYKNRLKFIRELIKSDVSHEERILLRTILKGETKTGNKNIKDARKDIASQEKEFAKERRKIAKTRRIMVRKIKKQINETIKKRKQEIKDIAKAEKAEEQLRQKQGIYLQEFKNDFLKELVEKHNPLIDKDINEMKDRFIAMQEEKEAKKQAANETRKLQKAAEAEHRKTVKQQQMLAKAAEKAAQKEAIAAEKAAQKEAIAAEKAAQKEAIAAEKAAQKEAIAEQLRKKAETLATKKLQAEQKKLNKTAKKHMYQFYYVCNETDKMFSNNFTNLGFIEGNKEDLIKYVSNDRFFCRDEKGISYNSFLDFIKTDTVIYITDVIDDKNILGCCCMRINTFSFIYITGICVPNNEIKGIGTLLLTKVHELAINLNKDIKLSASSPVKGFYEKFGFKDNLSYVVPLMYFKVKK